MKRPVILLLIFILGAAFSDDAADPAPEFTAIAWYNTPKPIKIADLRGQVVLLDFWGLWCSPCIKAIPKLDKLAEEMKTKPFRIITVHTTNRSDNLTDQIPKMKFKHVIFVDQERSDDPNGKTYGHTVRAYKVEAFPTYVLIDKKGNIRFSGEFPERQEIEKLLEE